MAEEICYFAWKFHCEDKMDILIESGPSQIQCIIKFSKMYIDRKADQLEENFNEDENFKILS